MDAAMKEKVEETVLEILRSVDMVKMSEFDVRKLAGEKLGMDLSEPSRKKFVRQVVEGFLQQRVQQQQQNDAVEGAAGGGEVEEEEEEESNNRRSDGKEYDDDGDLIICRLSDKRRVTVQDFKGKTLVSIREYYEKDGKFRPTSKGISLSAEQWSTFKKSLPAIEKAIDKMEARLS